MEEPAIPIGYLGGVIDCKGSLTVSFAERATYTTGFQPQVMVRVVSKSEPLIGFLDAVSEEYDLSAGIYENSKDSVEWVIQGVEPVGRLLATVYPYLIIQHDRATILLEEILPLLDEGRHKDEEGLIELAGYVDTMCGRDRRRKYTQAFFIERFNPDPKWSADA